MRNGDYILILAPEEYPGKKYRDKYAYEHHVVFWQNTGKVIKKDEAIHHLNEDKHDNRIENLELVTKSYHGKMHSVPAETTIATCHHCQGKFDITVREFKRRFKRNSGRLYCSRSCQISLQMKLRNRHKNEDIKLTCTNCNKDYTLAYSVYNTRRKRNKPGKMYCSRSCQMLYQHKTKTI